MKEWQPTKIQPFLLHTYRACAPPPPLDIVEKVLSRLKVTIKADILCPEIQRRIDNRNEAEALSH